MRKLSKSPIPQVLLNEKEAWEAAYDANPSDTNRNRYRKIKADLMEECGAKCVYCESKVGHNCPGDIDHKLPVTRHRAGLFDWNNMTISCNECNKRKSDYCDPSLPFLDPYVDDVEDLLLHLGPLVFPVAGNSRAELTVALLELDNHKKRSHLFGRKFEKLEEIRRILRLIAMEDHPAIRTTLQRSLDECCDTKAEFSAMVIAYVKQGNVV